jgi:hypothetical protein
VLQRLVLRYSNHISRAYKTLQVDVEIIDIDRNGIMLGKLYVVESETKQSRRSIENAYAYSLVQEGLAWVDR